jgi:4-amino-4-deoxy-L-arabinose transferase-like glycosyltransferase
MVSAWAREAAGPRAALIALVLTAFHPAILAHGHLATTDVVAAAAMLLASWCCWRWCRRPTALRAVLTGLALGAAVTTRLTAWLLAPCLVMLALTVWGRPPDTPPPTARQRAGFLVALAVAVPLVIWTGHGFHLPDAYLEGVRYQFAHGTGGHPAYLLGERSRGGWRHYFLVAFAVKNTPGFLLATVAGLAGAWSARRGRDRATRRHWALPAAVLFLAASAQHINIGERYILAVYPYLILLAASAAGPWLESGKGRLVVAGALALHALPALFATRAGHLTYFNLLAGGARNGHRVLLDSNLDWGQDLPRLAGWMRQQGVARVQLAYHGSDHPARLGIEREDLPGFTLYPPRPPARPFEGVVAVSPNLLFNVFPRLGDPYRGLREKVPDDRAGTFFIYFMDPGRPAAVR